MDSQLIKFRRPSSKLVCFNKFQRIGLLTLVEFFTFNFYILIIFFIKI